MAKKKTKKLVHIKDDVTSPFFNRALMRVGIDPIEFSFVLQKAFDERDIETIYSKMIGLFIAGANAYRFEQDKFKEQKIEPLDEVEEDDRKRRNSYIG